MILETGSGAKRLAGCVGGLGPNVDNLSSARGRRVLLRFGGRSVVTKGARTGCVGRPHVTVVAQGRARQGAVGALGSKELGTNVPTAAAADVRCYPKERELAFSMET
jgi:hypothetical protein